MRIRRNSWHYRFIRAYYNHSDSYMERHWEPQHNTLCSYWAVLAGVMIMALVKVFAAAAAVVALVVLLLHAPLLEVLVITGIAVVTIVAITAIVAVFIMIYDAIRKRSNLIFARLHDVQLYRCRIIQFESSNEQTE